MTMTSGYPAETAVWATPVPDRLRPGDLAGLAAVGLRTRKLRAGLSALGIAIGVAAIVAVLGLAASSSAALLAEIAFISFASASDSYILNGDFGQGREHWDQPARDWRGAALPCLH